MLRQRQNAGSCWEVRRLCTCLSCLICCTGINKLLEQHPVPEGQYSKWVDTIEEVREKFPMWHPEKEDVIIPQWAIKVLTAVTAHFQCKMSGKQVICTISVNMTLTNSPHPAGAVSYIVAWVDRGLWCRSFVSKTKWVSLSAHFVQHCIRYCSALIAPPLLHQPCPNSSNYAQSQSPETKHMKDNFRQPGGPLLPLLFVTSCLWLQTLCEETNGEAIITTGVGQHQMWAAQWYQYNEPRRWASSGGLGSMGFGLPAALGAAVAFDGTDSGREKRVGCQTNTYHMLQCCQPAGFQPRRC